MSLQILPFSPPLQVLFESGVCWAGGRGVTEAVSFGIVPLVTRGCCMENIAGGLVFLLVERRAYASRAVFLPGGEGTVEFSVLFNHHRLSLSISYFHTP